VELRLLPLSILSELLFLNNIVETFCFTAVNLDAPMFTTKKNTVQQTNSILAVRA